MTEKRGVCWECQTDPQIMGQSGDIGTICTWCKKPIKKRKRWYER